jgi:4-hydroxybenzoate polyprenyltransferase
VPVLTAHKLGDQGILARAGLAFAAFCLCASAAYLLNDLTDLDADRHHASKRQRPFASGALALAYGFMASPVLFLCGAAIAWSLSPTFAAVMAGYFVTTLAYSWQIKRIAMLDVFVLAGLYTLRLVGGHVATGIEWSAWLLVFSMFIFLSLALMKRVQELLSVREGNGDEVKGRGYTARDLELVSMLGVVSGFLAVLVLALYVNSEQVRTLYAHPNLLLVVCALLLYWVARIWLLAHRGQMQDDPTAFAFKDWVSYVIGGLTLGIMWFATGH